MVAVASRDGLDVDPGGVEVVVLAASQGIGRADDHAVGLHCHLAQVVVVPVFVGDKHQVSGQVVTLTGKGVDVDDRPGPGGDAAAGVSLKEQCCHGNTSLCHSLCFRKQNVTAKKIAR